MKRTLLVCTMPGIFAMATPSWHVPHWLAALGALVMLARPKSWDLHHWFTMLGALALAGVSTWLKYGGPDFQVWDTPILALVLLVLRAMYQTPPAKT